MDKKKSKREVCWTKFVLKGPFQWDRNWFFPPSVQDLKRSSRGAERTPNIHGKREEEGMKSKFSGGGGRAGLLKVRQREILSAFLQCKKINF